MNLQFFSIPAISEFSMLNHYFGVFPNYKLILNAVSFSTFVEVFLETFGLSRKDVVGHGGAIACRKITFGDQPQRLRPSSIRTNYPTRIENWTD